MKRAVIVLGFALAAGCGADPVLPQYMQDLPRTEEETLRVVEEIRRELGEDTLVERVEDYFFVASNDSPESFAACKSTISRVYRYLYRDYFERRPEKPIRVYLFRNKLTYDVYCRSAYEKPPATPFGFYMARERKMVMNISTGNGTLAHELVHPLLGEDFPGVPSWFNEGFASLFEESGERDGKMVGFVNWRLPKLKQMLRINRGVKLSTLMVSGSEKFYGDDDRGLNYATARYLCLYLQEHDLLIPFFKEFRANAASDSSGIRSLQKVSGKTLPEFEPIWRSWVMELPAKD